MMMMMMMMMMTMKDGDDSKQDLYMRLTSRLGHNMAHHSRHDHRVARANYLTGDGEKGSDDSEQGLYGTLSGVAMCKPPSTRSSCCACSRPIHSALQLFD